MLRITFFLFFIASSCLAQQDINEVLKNPSILNSQYKEVSTQFISKDLSRLWARETPAIGFIGDQFERLSMILLTAKPIENHGDYEVTGKSRVKNNVCTFSGNMSIKAIYLSRQDQKHGYIIGAYLLKEDSTQSHSGIFSGVFITRIVLDDTGNIQLDIEKAENGRNWNNAFSGNWKMHKGNLIMQANWGNSWIPASGDLDQGKEEFLVNEKYLRSNWKNYFLAYKKADPKALEKEKQKWW